MVLGGACKRNFHVACTLPAITCRATCKTSKTVSTQMFDICSAWMLHAHRLRLQAENQALQNCLQAADLDRCDLERSLDQAQGQRTSEVKQTAGSSTHQTTGVCDCLPV